MLLYLLLTIGPTGPSGPAAPDRPGDPFFEYCLIKSFSSKLLKQS